MNETVWMRGGVARGTRPPENGSALMASMRGLVGGGFVVALAMWKVSSRELGSEARKRDCGVLKVESWR